jgi:hypothetical protein|eukprot:2961024-Prymnesium_polylepis.2
MTAYHFPDGVPSKIQSNATPCSKDLEELALEAIQLVEAPDAQLLRQYESIVGGLLYCSTNTRPDIAFSCGMLCRAMSKPIPELLEAAQSVLGLGTWG